MDNDNRAYFLTVEWCNDGKRGIFCHKDGNAFSKDDAPHTDEEAWDILGPFHIILDPKSEPFSEEDVAQFTSFRALAEYSHEYGIALQEGEKKWKGLSS